MGASAVEASSDTAGARHTTVGEFMRLHAAAMTVFLAGASLFTVTLGCSKDESTHQRMSEAASARTALLSDCPTDAPTAISGSAILLVLELPNGDTLRSSQLSGVITAAPGTFASDSQPRAAATGLRVATLGYSDSLRAYTFSQSDRQPWFWTAGFMHYGTFDVRVATDRGLSWDTSGVVVPKTACSRPATARLVGRLRSLGPTEAVR